MAAVEKLKETRGFIEECWVELQKVTWPCRSDEPTAMTERPSAGGMMCCHSLARSLPAWFTTQTPRAAAISAAAVISAVPPSRSAKVYQSM